MSTVKKVTRSSVYHRAQANAEQLIHHPGKLQRLIRAVMTKILNKRLAPFKDIGGSLMTSLRLLKAYASGRYAALPKHSLIALVAALAYFVMPADLIPDLITGIGLFDDMALLGWVLKSLKTDLQKFQTWESTHAPADH